MSTEIINLEIDNNHLPKNIEAEQTILGSILENNELLMKLLMKSMKVIFMMQYIKKFIKSFQI